ncbi:hypothetical protein ACN27F_28785 [Solwaraspora sp. WMMB335]|uniref:hypothetical protein n=1 Tax=Solwaraspora sp. WMMB335 TaxID=3404118 RepID=UPI003B931BA2
MPDRLDCPDLATALHAGSREHGEHGVLLQLLDVEFWLIGRDVEHPRGNLLLQLGFTREPPTVGARGRSRYRRRAGDEHVVLWGWGLYLARDGIEVLLTRSGGPFAAAGPPDVFERPSTAGRDTSATHALVAACDWLAAYEDRVDAGAGIAHRVPRPDSTPTAAPPEPWTLSAAWRELGALVARTGAELPATSRNIADHQEATGTNEAADIAARHVPESTHATERR